MSNAVGLDGFGKDKTFKGDDILAQLTDFLSAAGEKLPETARRPDVRMILNNAGPDFVEFKNPGGHADKNEAIPGSGDKTAAMIMLQGTTLAEQQQNAATLDARYNLSTKGFSAEFLTDLESGSLGNIVKEAYGPAPYAKQAEQLKPVEWVNDDGSKVNVDPVTNSNAAYGARPPSKEQVFIVRVPTSSAALYVKGTNTSAEKLVDNGKGYKSMAVGVAPVLDDKWQPTGAFTTRPIALSAAKEFYGQGFNNIPVVDLDDKGVLKAVQLKPAASAPAQERSKKF